MTSTSWHGEAEQAQYEAWLVVRAVACRQAARAGIPIAIPRERAGVDAPRPWWNLEFRICGARPRRGDGTLWCERPAGHAGLHHGDGMSFSARNPRERVTTSGRLVAEAAPRQSGR